MAAHIWEDGDQVSPHASAEQRLSELGIALPPPPTPFGAYVEAVKIGNLLFLSGMLRSLGTSHNMLGASAVRCQRRTGERRRRLLASMPCPRPTRISARSTR